MNYLIIKLKNETTLISKVEEVNYVTDGSGNRNISISVDDSGMLYLYNPKILPEIMDWIPEMKTVNGVYIIPINADNILTVGEPDDAAIIDYLNGGIVEEVE